MISSAAITVGIGTTEDSALQSSMCQIMLISPMLSYTTMPTCPLAASRLQRVGPSASRESTGVDEYVDGAVDELVLRWITEAVLWTPKTIFRSPPISPCAGCRGGSRTALGTRDGHQVEANFDRQDGSGNRLIEHKVEGDFGRFNGRATRTLTR
jgi:hypothetical protein